MKLPKTLKIIFGVILFLTLPTTLFVGVIYFKYHEDLPESVISIEADKMAQNMLNALDYKALEKTSYLEWTYRNSRHYKWERDKHICTVFWKQYKVALNLNDYSKSKTYVHNFSVVGKQQEELIDSALSYFKNDSFWLLAPYTVFDKGTTRRVVSQNDGSKALLVTYTTEGKSSEDSYLWKLDENGKPISFKIWNTLTPIQGLEASWQHWTTTQSGAQLPTLHTILFFNIQLRNIKGTLK
ncbi:MAG: hypothetical protein HRT67_08665 [Flavobacteriaceae bacterium]|nr:hypothetical protein [Flavobacteriaceae bacterium]